MMYWRKQSRRSRTWLALQKKLVGGIREYTKVPLDGTLKEKPQWKAPLQLAKQYPSGE
jgi:hypothetical protein